MQDAVHISQGRIAATVINVLSVDELESPDRDEDGVGGGPSRYTDDPQAAQYRASLRFIFLHFGQNGGGTAAGGIGNPIMQLRSFHKPLVMVDEYPASLGPV